MATNRINKSIVYRPSAIIPFFDPLAQSFIVGKTSILTKVEVYFQEKDSALPIKCEIRTIENGIPSNVVLPFSQVSIKAANVNISSNSDQGTLFNFTSPVLVEPGSYAFCLFTDSSKYKVWISQLGERDVKTGEVITKQPSLGVLFKATNSTTWTPDQQQDLKMRLYRAKFTVGQTATIDLHTGSLSGKLDFLDNNPFELIPGSREMKVYHTNHGLREGSYVINSLYTLPGFGNIASNANTTSNVYGLLPNIISGSVQVVNNVKLNSYTVDLGVVPPLVSGITRFGGETKLSSVDIEYDSMYPAIGYVNPPETSILQRYKPCNTDYILDNSYITLEEDDYTFDNLKIIPSPINNFNKMSNAVATSYRLELVTTNQYVAPMVDANKLGIVVFKNIINNPTYESENLAREKVVIYQGNNIGFTNISNTTGSINLNSTIARSNAVSIVKGTQIEIRGSNNTGNVRVLDIRNNGQNVIVYGNVINENLVTNATANVQIVNGTQFVFEEAARGGSAISKYITKQINFINPSIGFKFFIDVSKPVDTNIKFYYRTSLVGETADLNDKEFVEVTSVIIPDSLSGNYYEIEKLVDNIAQFDGIQFKIVFLSDSPIKIPKCKNLRLIALA